MTGGHAVLISGARVLPAIVGVEKGWDFREIGVFTKAKSDELRAVFQACRRYFVTALIFSLAINLLFLAGPLYMLQVYDRVISSASHVTLVMLTLALLLAFIALAGLDFVRARILTRASVRLDRLLAGRVLAATVENSVKGAPPTSQPLRDFDTFRQFVTGAGIHAVFDLPWAPIYIFVIFLLHPLLGLFALASAIVLVCLAVLGQWRVQGPIAEASATAARNYAFTDMSLRNAEVVQAMGMMPGLIRRWGRDRGLALERQVTASDRAASNASIVRFLRLSMQSLILGLGAYLVIERVATVGAMFAATILLGRALQPVEQIVGSWRNMISARGAFQRIKTLLAANPERDPALALPRPAGRLAVEGLVYGIPRSPEPDPARHLVSARCRRDTRRDRAVGRGQIDARAPDRRRARALRRRGAARRRRRLDLAAGIARPLSRLSAAGH